MANNAGKCYVKQVLLRSQVNKAFICLQEVGRELLIFIVVLRNITVLPGVSI